MLVQNQRKFFSARRRDRSRWKTTPAGLDTAGASSGYHLSTNALRRVA